MSKVNEKDTKSKNEKGIKSFFKNDIKVIIAFILGLIISGFGVYFGTKISSSNNELKTNTNTQSNIKDVEKNSGEETNLGDAAVYFDSANVSYNNSNSGLTSNRVQNAIDELYAVANSTSFWVKKYKTFAAVPQYYAFGTYKGWCSSTDTNCNSYADFPTTETTPPSGKNVYAAKYADGQYGVCIIRNGTEHCFRGRNYIAESKHIQEVFSDISCNVYSYYVYCHASDFYCLVDADGGVLCNDYGSDVYCDVSPSGYVRCD